MASSFEEWMEQRYPNWRGDAFTTPVPDALLAQLREAYEAGRKARQPEIDRLMHLHEDMQERYEGELSRLERDSR